MYLFTPLDVFALGIGFDIAGGYLVARGLLIAPTQILRRSIKDEHYFIPAETASLIRDRVDALFGLIILLVGFLTQAVGYALEAAGQSGVVSSHDGLARAVISLAGAAVGVATGLGTWLARRWPLSRRLIVSVSRDPLSLDTQYSLIQEARAPSAARLMRLGGEFGRGPLADEDPADYVRRVYGLDEISLDDPLSSAFHPARLT